MRDLLTVAIVPEGERVSLAALEQAVQDIRRLVQHVDRAVTRDHSPRRRTWYVERLSSSSPTMLLEPEVIAAVVGPTSDIVVDGVRFITEPGREGPPEYFSEQELEDLLRIQKTFRRGVSRLDLSSEERQTASITPATTESVKQILGQEVKALGSLEGVMEAIDVHVRPRFTIWERLSGQAVRCYFDPAETERVKGLLRARVRVSGLISYFPDGRPRSVAHLDTVEAIRPKAGRSYWATVRGLVGQTNSVEYLRAAGNE